MNSGIYEASQGMAAQWDYQSTIASNLSRSMVPGYKRSFAVFSVPSGDNSSVQTGETASSSGANLGEPSIQVTSRIDFSQGTLAPSDNPLHMGILGGAFFSVKEANGSISYTRNGQFRLDNKGNVVTYDGARVLLKGGGPLQVQDAGRLTVQPNGSISASDQSLGKLALVHFADPGKALMEGPTGRFVALHGAQPLDGPAEGDQVMQRQLEGSNEGPTTGMMNLIEVARAYEANQKVIATEDDATGKIIHATTS